VGGVLWAGGVTLAGYALGDSIPNVDRYLLPIVGVIIVASLVPVGLEVLRSRRAAEVGPAEGEILAPDAPEVGEPR